MVWAKLTFTLEEKASNFRKEKKREEEIKRKRRRKKTEGRMANHVAMMMQQDSVDPSGGFTHWPHPLCHWDAPSKCRTGVGLVMDEAA